MLQVIVIALFFGGAILAAGEKAKSCAGILSPPSTLSSSG